MHSTQRRVIARLDALVRTTHGQRALARALGIRSVRTAGMRLVFGLLEHGGMRPDTIQNRLIIFKGLHLTTGPIKPILMGSKTLGGELALSPRVIEGHGPAVP